MDQDNFSTVKTSIISLILDSLLLLIFKYYYCTDINDYPQKKAHIKLSKEKIIKV